MNVSAQGGDDNRRVFAGHLYEREASKHEGIARSICRQTVPNLFCKIYDDAYLAELKKEGLL